jgi:hypothetical protein
MMIPRKIPHFIEIERNSCTTRLGVKSSLNSGIRCAPVTGVENPFLCGMQSSEPSFILTSTGRTQKTDQRVTDYGFSESVWSFRVFAMIHLDYLSCLLTVPATILLARKSWIGLLVATVNSLKHLQQDRTSRGTLCVLT